MPSPALAKIPVLAGKKRRAHPWCFLSCLRQNTSFGGKEEEGAQWKRFSAGKKKRKREDAPKRGCIIKIIIIINYLGVIGPAKGPMGP